MEDDPEDENEDVSLDESTYSPKQRQIGSGDRKCLRILLGVLILSVFLVGIVYFFNRLRSSDETNPLELKVIALERKIAGLEQQLADLAGKIRTTGSDSALIQRVDALALKVETLENQTQAAPESKANPFPPSKPAALTEKQYHRVQKGETLYRIGRKYGISVEELQKLNNLSSDQPLRAGQRLVVSPRR